MDPVALKFAQLIAAEILGGILCLGGIFLFMRGVSGKSNLLLEGGGLKAKLTNGAPGSVIALIGAAIVALSLHSSVERVDRRSSSNDLLPTWLKNTESLNDKMDYTQTIDTIVGKGPNIRFVNESRKVDATASLEQLAQADYADKKYWKLIAAINKDKNYFIYSTATPDTIIPAGSIYEIWRPSAYNGMVEETRTRVSGANRTAAYDELLARAETGEIYDLNKLVQEFKLRELSLAFSPASDNLKTLREVSIKFYGDGKYWPLLVWSNSSLLTGNVTDQTTPPHNLYVPHFLGWPR